jgi:hypothetical protein
MGAPSQLKEALNQVQGVGDGGTEPTKETLNQVQGVEAGCPGRRGLGSGRRIVKFRTSKCFSSPTSP